MEESERDYWYHIGESAGLKGAAIFLMEKSVKFFETGNHDAEARDLRKYSQDLLKMASECHPNRNSISL